MKLLEGKVAIVTGSGGGLGRCHALAMAAEGAKIVINDLGSTRDGAGQSRSMADQVVEEIRKAGGQAVANYDSVASTEGAERLVKTALEAFGRLDILVNNAGILRDKTILKMEDEMWDAVIAVHLRGTFACTRAAARAMTNGGRIVNTTSVSGLRGNFGQSNYSAAKAGIYGFTLTSAMELAKQNITVNAIAPIAKTRMTEDVEQVSVEMRPEDVSPVVVFLASDLAKDVTGRIFGVHGKHIFEYEMKVTEGFKKETGLWTPSEIRAKLDAPQETPKTAPTDDGGSLKQFFVALPTCFVPGDWAATYHFAVSGAGDWTVEVKNDKCKTSEGKPAQPTCVVTLDAATMLGMISGKVKPDAAFMAGKIKANNVKDLGRFGKAFNLEKLRGAKPAEGGSLKHFFASLPSVFQPADWNATLCFSVTGAGDWTIQVNGNTCTTSEGKPANPTCVVTIDATTLTGMIQGKVNPDAAYMQGKIKATNVKDLMKFGKAFNLKKLQGGGPTPAVARGPVNVGPLLEQLPRKFIPEKSVGWNGAIQFVVDGTESVLEIQNKTCSSRTGRHPSPTLTLTTDGATLAALLEGALDAQKAFSEGKLKVSNPIGFLKFKQCFTFEPDKGLRRSLIGKTYRAPALLVRGEWMEDYGKTVEDSDSPIFPVTLIKPMFMALIEDPDFNGDLSRMVHGEQVIVYHAPLKPWDLISPRGKVLAIDDKSTGQVLNYQQMLYCEGRPVVEMETRLFFRGEASGKPSDKQVTERPSPQITEDLRIASDLSYRYAKASGDNNPIHVDPALAQAAGFKGVILHGLCTLALTVGRLRQGKPVRKVAVRFAKPVYPGETYKIRAWRENEKTMTFETVSATGERVLTEGSLILA